jgi:hypothetical protein
VVVVYLEDERRIEKSTSVKVVTGVGTKLIAATKLATLPTFYVP